MDELIYQFLLQSGYPRASIVADASLLTSGGAVSVPEEATTYVIVDPDTAEPLAALHVVEAIDGDTLQAVAGRVGRYARHLGGRDTQGFVIRVDPRGRNDAEQVQFYRVWPNPAVQQLSAKTFPDLDALRMARRLSLASAADREPEVFDEPGPSVPRTYTGGRQTGGVGRWLPGILLALLALADWYVGQTRGAALFSVSQALLATGAAAMLTLSAVTGRTRD